jgi:6-phosphogluconolactonase (cycloisomerase 2 family)
VLDNALAIFARNPSTGRLTFEEVHFDGVDADDGLAQARWVELSPDGKHVYVAALIDDAVSVFRVLPQVVPAVTPAGRWLLGALLLGAALLALRRRVHAKPAV